MGLDFLDLTYRIEKKFDIDISENDLTDIVSDYDIAVGDLYDLLLKKMHLRDVARNDIRLNYQLWAELQGLLHAITNVSLDRIELGTPLEALFPRKTRRETWTAFRAASPYRIRDLDYPAVVRFIGLLLTAGVVLIEQFQIWQIPGVNWLWPVLGLFGAWMFSETYLKILAICAPLRNSFPSGLTTVKDLCRAVLATNYVDICENVEVPLDQRCLEVWPQLTAVLVDTLGIDADEITFRSRLIRDLGMS